MACRHQQRAPTRTLDWLPVCAASRRSASTSAFRLIRSRYCAEDLFAYATSCSHAAIMLRVLYCASAGADVAPDAPVCAVTDRNDQWIDGAANGAGETRYFGASRCEWNFGRGEWEKENELRCSSACRRSFLCVQSLLYIVSFRFGRDWLKVFYLKSGDFSQKMIMNKAKKIVGLRPTPPW